MTSSLPDITKASFFEEINYEPHSEGQADYHFSPYRFKVTCCGRRWGKSTSAGTDLAHAVYNPTNAGNTYWIVGPTYELGEREFEVVYDVLMHRLELANDSRVRSAYSVKQGNMYITMPWKTTVRVVSADKPKSLLGKGLAGVIMSEAGEHSEETWTRFIRPALSDKHGWAHFPTTPKGFNWFYDMFMLGHDPHHPEWHSWHFPSWTNPVVFPGGRQDPEIIEAEATSNAIWFDQEYGAEFTALEGRIYTEWDPSVHIRKIDYNPNWRNYLVIDFGYSAPWVALDIMVDGMQNVYVWREYYVKGLSTWDHGKALIGRRNPANYKISAVFADPHDTGEIATLQQSINMGVFAEPTDWKEGIDKCKWLMKVNEVEREPGSIVKETKFFVDPSCEHFIREIPRLQTQKIRPGEKNPSEKQRDYDDHCCDAFRYFVAGYFILGIAGSHIDQVYADIPRKENLAAFTLDDGGFTYNDGELSPSKMVF